MEFTHNHSENENNVIHTYQSGKSSYSLFNKIKNKIPSIIAAFLIFIGVTIHYCVRSILENLKFKYFIVLVLCI